MQVGVVGRTGAGKSSVINALFRLTELCGGTVRVDGLDISRARLAELRRAMALIPQHPTLFTGTLRSNLAPEAAHVSDDDLWDALRAAHLHGTCRATCCAVRSVRLYGCRAQVSFSISEADLWCGNPTATLALTHYAHRETHVRAMPPRAWACPS